MIPNPHPTLAVLDPIFNDWDCLEYFIRDLAATPHFPASITLFVVDDGSTEPAPHLSASASRSVSVEMPRLGTNLGHQRGIATGLVEIRRRGGFDAVVVMDADGEARTFNAAYRGLAWPLAVLTAYFVASLSEVFQDGWVQYTFYSLLIVLCLTGSIRHLQALATSSPLKTATPLNKSESASG